MSNPKVLKFLELLRGTSWIDPDTQQDCSSNEIVREIFNHGNCGNLALILQMAFGGTLYRVVYHLHIIIKIEDTFYDIDGVWEKNDWLQEVDEKWLHDHNYIDNYSFPDRGPVF